MNTELKNIVNHIVYDRQEEAKSEFSKYIEAKVKQRIGQSSNTDNVVENDPDQDDDENF